MPGAKYLGISLADIFPVLSTATKAGVNLSYSNTLNMWIYFTAINGRTLQNKTTRNKIKYKIRKK